MITRSQENQELYDKFKKSVLKEYQTMEDYIKIVYLNYNSSGIKKRAIKTANSLQYKLLKNPYPYDFGDNISHYVLFSTKKLSKEKQLEIINENINKKFIYFTNPYDKRSIKNLWHLHILVYQK